MKIRKLSTETLNFLDEVIAASKEPNLSEIIEKAYSTYSSLIDNDGDDKAMQSIFSDVKSSTDGSSVMKTGWQRMNDMLQGGFRRGDFVMIGALQHKYKTDLTLSRGGIVEIQHEKSS